MPAFRIDRIALASGPVAPKSGTAHGGDTDNVEGENGDQPGVAQWLGRRSVAGGLSLIYA